MPKHSKRKKINRLAKKFARGLKILGPGFVSGAADNDPSGIGTYSIAGAMYGLSLLWLCPFLLPLMFTMQEMCARIGLVTSQGLTANMKKFFPRPIIYGAIILLVIANIINISANIAIMSASAQLVSGINFNILAIIFTGTIILMEVFVPYNIYSKILISLAFILFSYVIVAFMTNVDWLYVFKHTITPRFTFNKNFIILVTGYIGTTISPYLFFWQSSHEIEDKLDNMDFNHYSYHRNKLIQKMRLDTFIGMLFAKIVIFFIIVTCFSTLHSHGITNITSASEAAFALKPLAGQWAYLLFCIGIIGTGFLGIPVIAGSAAYAMAEIFNKPEGLSYKFKDAMFFYSIIIFSLLLGLLINFSGINPIKALLYAAVINGIISVPITAIVLILGSVDISNF
jgi:Mn2+/Fe2+ NRAMP family transporter